MAVTPKMGRGKAPAKAGMATLSASQALKAAEAAIAPPAAAKPATPKSVPAKPVAAQPKPVAPKAAAPKVAPPKPATPRAAVADPVDPNPIAVIAATTAVDAAPASEPETTHTVQIAEGTKSMTDMMETGKKFAEDTKAKFETVYADLNEKAKSGVEKSTKAIEELSDLTKGNVEALVESGKIAAKGMETLGQEAVDYSRKSLEKATASFKSFATIKTPTEFFQLQSQMMSSSFDDFAKEAAKSSEAMMKLASEVASPLTARVSLVTDKVKSLAA
ncbi:phasin family protein [Sphingobium sp.]|uniref:phasin family protein n=1 Tax=Sphingobium sp. TaxID=1912891 RepID=UPI003BB66155